MKKLLVLLFLMVFAITAIGQNDNLGDVLGQHIQRLPDYDQMRKQIITPNKISYIYNDGSIMYMTNAQGYIQELTVVFSGAYSMQHINLMLLQVFESTAFAYKKVISTLPLKYEVALKYETKSRYFVVTRSTYKVGEKKEQILVVTASMRPYHE